MRNIPEIVNKLPGNVYFMFFSLNIKYPNTTLNKIFIRFTVMTYGTKVRFKASKPKIALNVKIEPIKSNLYLFL